MDIFPVVARHPRVAKQDIAFFDDFYKSLQVALTFFFGHTLFLRGLVRLPKNAAKFYTERITPSSNFRLPHTTGISGSAGFTPL
jgi:hypothetical protein